MSDFRKDLYEKVSEENMKLIGKLEFRRRENNHLKAEVRRLKPFVEKCSQIIDPNPDSAWVQLAQEARTALDAGEQECSTCDGTGFAVNCTEADRTRGDLWACGMCDGTGTIQETSDE